MYYTHY